MDLPKFVGSAAGRQFLSLEQLALDIHHYFAATHLSQLLSSCPKLGVFCFGYELGDDREAITHALPGMAHYYVVSHAGYSEDYDYHVEGIREGR